AVLVGCDQPALGIDRHADPGALRGRDLVDQVNLEILGDLYLGEKAHLRLTRAAGGRQRRRVYTAPGLVTELADDRGAGPPGGVEIGSIPPSSLLSGNQPVPVRHDGPGRLSLQFDLEFEKKSCPRALVILSAHGDNVLARPKLTGHVGGDGLLPLLAGQ